MFLVAKKVAQYGPEEWLSVTGQVAQNLPDYSVCKEIYYTSKNDIRQ